MLPTFAVLLGHKSHCVTPTPLLPRLASRHWSSSRSPSFLRQTQTIRSTQGAKLAHGSGTGFDDELLTGLLRTPAGLPPHLRTQYVTQVPSRDWGPIVTWRANNLYSAYQTQELPYLTSYVRAYRNEALIVYRQGDRVAHPLTPEPVHERPPRARRASE